jgi:repressor LexA
MKYNPNQGDDMESLSEGQKKVLDFIENYSSKNGIAPTYDVIAKHLGYAGKSSVQHYIEALQFKGYLTKHGRLSDGMAIHRVKEENLVPLLGKVAAGVPIEHRKYDENIDVPASMLKKSGNYFALQISGDSMIGEGILDGDYVIIKKQSSANNGDIVVAEIDDEATIKRFYKKKTHVELHSANPKYKPIIVNAIDKLKIIGIWYGLIRHRNV